MSTIFPRSIFIIIFSFFPTYINAQLQAPEPNFPEQKLMGNYKSVHSYESFKTFQRDKYLNIHLNSRNKRDTSKIFNQFQELILNEKSSHELKLEIAEHTIRQILLEHKSFDINANRDEDDILFIDTIARYEYFPNDHRIEYHLFGVDHYVTYFLNDQNQILKEYTMFKNVPQLVARYFYEDENLSKAELYNKGHLIKTLKYKHDHQNRLIRIEHINQYDELTAIHTYEYKRSEKLVRYIDYLLDGNRWKTNKTIIFQIKDEKGSVVKQIEKRKGIFKKWNVYQYDIEYY